MTTPKTPPRFVPTLTDVVQLPDAVRFAAGKPEPAPVVPPSATVAPPPVPVTLEPDARPVRSLPDGIEEYVVHRVMQRVDLVLDQRLREAIALVVQEQTRSMVPRLREEVESVVRHAVYEAVADELAGGDGAAR
ncbi:MAG: hypothetical protein JSR53_15515 [Proteobacteria bacterium]|nr:hypothetical protein [Pseudomonadota bacterium]